MGCFHQIPSPSAQGILYKRRQKDFKSQNEFRDTKKARDSKFSLAHAQKKAHRPRHHAQDLHRSATDGVLEVIGELDTSPHL